MADQELIVVKVGMESPPVPQCRGRCLKLGGRYGNEEVTKNERVQIFSINNRLAE